MPFDGAPQPSLKHLVEVLRAGPGHPDWPERFEFDYRYCDKCAIGLAQQLGYVRKFEFEEMARAFGLSCESAYMLLGAGFGGDGRCPSREELADRIEAWPVP